MRSDAFKQAIVIQESNAADFQNALNNALSGLNDPEINIEKSIPFTAYIFYTARRDVPESVLELFEMIDGDHHTCEECPYLTMPNYKRVKRGTCSIKSCRTRKDSRACERFYLWKHKQLEQTERLYEQIPYVAD